MWHEVDLDAGTVYGRLDYVASTKSSSHSPPKDIPFLIVVEAKRSYGTGVVNFKCQLMCGMYACAVNQQPNVKIFIHSYHLSFFYNNFLNI